MKKTAAFTLIELLVVIVIIAILAGIALPVFSKVLEKSHVTQDCSNLRQLGIGTVAYLNDNNDTFFTKDNFTPASNNLYPPGVLQINYVPNPKVFQSPFDKNLSDASRSTGAHPISYGINSKIYEPTTASPIFDGNSSKLTAASQLILYTVAYNGDPTIATSWTGKDTAAVEVQAPGNALTVGTHQAGKWLDVLYADYHVGTIKLTDFHTINDNSASGGIDGVAQWEPRAHSQ